MVSLLALNIPGYGEWLSVISGQSTGLVSFGGLSRPGLGLFLGDRVEDVPASCWIRIHPIEELRGLIGLVVDCADGVYHSLLCPE